MKIIIVGAGFTGLRLARALTNSGGNTVTLIDRNEEVCRNASNHLDCAVMCADGNSQETLKTAGVETADALVCVTDSDEVNMITCSLVNAAYPAKAGGRLGIARVRNETYYTPGKTLAGIDWMISPDVEAAEAIVQAVRHGAAGDVLTFDESDYVLSSVYVAEGSPFSGKKLSSLRSLTKVHFLVTYMEVMIDTDEREVVLPSGNTMILAGSVLGIVTRKEDTKEVFALCGTQSRDLHDIAIVGAGRIGSIIAKKLLQDKLTEEDKGATSWFNKLLGKVSRAKEKDKRNVVIIDSDEKLSAKAAEEFDKVARVFCADATDEAFLSEEGITSFDLVVCATHNHELNMVLAAYLENLGVGQSISLVESSAFAAIARKLGVDVAVPLQDTIVDSIISHLRGAQVKGVHTVAAGDLEIIECIVGENGAVKGKALKQIAQAGVFLVVLVSHKGTSASSYNIPNGETALQEGDSCILITKSSESERIIALFAGAKG